jgi:DNA-binding response OmpR family regulator
MKKASKPASMARGTGGILSVSPVEDDHSALECIFRSQRQLARTRTLTSALDLLRQTEYAVVMCERDLWPGSWKDLLQGADRLSNPPLLIVTSRHADDRLWAEALNLGAWDVLAKPFDPGEVVRVVNLACQRWQREQQAAVQSVAAGAAAGGM